MPVRKFSRILPARPQSNSRAIGVEVEIARNGESIRFSAKKFQLLRYFIDHTGETGTRETLLQEVRGYSAIAYTRTVDVHIAWLR